MKITPKRTAMIVDRLLQNGSDSRCRGTDIEEVWKDLLDLDDDEVEIWSTPHPTIGTLLLVTRSVTTPEGPQIECSVKGPQDNTFSCSSGPDLTHAMCAALLNATFTSARKTRTPGASVTDAPRPTPEAPAKFAVLTVGQRGDIVKVLDQHGRCLMHTDAVGALALLQAVEHPPVEAIGRTVVHDSIPGVKTYARNERLVIDPDLDYDRGTGEIFDVLTVMLCDQHGVKASIALHGEGEREQFAHAIRAALPTGTRVPRDVPTLGTIRSVSRTESVTRPFRNEGPLPFTVHTEGDLIVVSDDQGRTLIQTNAMGIMAMVQLIETTHTFPYPIWNGGGNVKDRTSTEVLAIETQRHTTDKVDSLTLRREKRENNARTYEFTYDREKTIERGFMMSQLYRERNEEASVLLVGKPHQTAFLNALKAHVPETVQPHANPEEALTGLIGPELTVTLAPHARPVLPKNRARTFHGS